MEFDADRFRSARIKSGMSQDEAAKRIGVSVGGLRHWEHGDYGPRTIMLQKAVEEFIVAVETGEIAGPGDVAWSKHHASCDRCGSTEYRYWGKGICWKCRQEDMTNGREEREAALTDEQRSAIVVDVAGEVKTIRQIAREQGISAAKVREVVAEAERALVA